MKKGDVVMIYKDPITEKEPEGKARLVKKQHESDYSEFWQVAFVEDGDDFGTVCRRLKKKEVRLYEK